MLAHAEGCGLDTAFSRGHHEALSHQASPAPAAASAPMGPAASSARTPKKTGICGADMGTIASRHFARQVAAGVAAHSDHGRDMAMTLRAVATGEAAGYKVKDEQKLHVVAAYLGIPTSGREVNEIALDVADVALAQFGQPHGEIIYTKRATPKRQAKWRELGLTPRAIDREIVEVMHRTPRARPGCREHPRPGPVRLPHRRLGGVHAGHRYHRHLVRDADAVAEPGEPRRAEGRRGERGRPRP
jgi:carbon-monoxide dehydrogenase catalytic subunit